MVDFSGNLVRYFFLKTATFLIHLKNMLMTDFWFMLGAVKKIYQLFFKRGRQEKRKS